MSEATPHGVRGRVTIGHFRYEHIDALVEQGEAVQPEQAIGWTWRDTWHVHLTEFVFSGNRRLLVNPLRPGGKLHPYVDRAAPELYELRYYRPATPTWRRRPGTTVARLPQAGERLDKRRLSGRVDVRVRMSDPQSYIGWFSELPWLAAPHHPFRLAVAVIQLGSGQVVERRDVFWAEQMLTSPAGQHYAPGTDQNLPADACMRRHERVACDGRYWFRVFPQPYWDTTRLPNGSYRLRVRAWDVTGNMAKADTVVTVRNA